MPAKVNPEFRVIIIIKVPLNDGVIAVIIIKMLITDPQLAGFGELRRCGQNKLKVLVAASHPVRIDIGELDFVTNLTDTVAGKKFIKLIIE